MSALARHGSWSSPLVYLLRSIIVVLLNVLLISSIERQQHFEMYELFCCGLARVNCTIESILSIQPSGTPQVTITADYHLLVGCLVKATLSRYQKVIIMMQLCNFQQFRLPLPFYALAGLAHHVEKSVF